MVDPAKQAAVVALIGNEGDEEIVEVGRYYVNDDKHTAEIVLTVRDDYHNRGIGRELISRSDHARQGTRNQWLHGQGACGQPRHAPPVPLF